MKKHKTAANEAAQQFLNIEGIQENLIHTKDHWLIGFLSVRGPDNKLLDGADREAAMRNLSTVLREDSSLQPWQLLSIPRVVDMVSIVEQLEALAEGCQQETTLLLLRGEIEALRKLMQDGAKEPLLLLKIWEHAVPGADQRINRRLEMLEHRLPDCGIKAHRLENGEIKWLCKLYAALDLFTSRSEENTDIPLLIGKKRRITTNVPENEAAQLLNAITPVGGYTFNSNTLQIGNVIGRCYGVVKYPPQVSYGWLVQLMSCLDAVTCLTYYPGSGELGDALSRAIHRSATNMAASNDARTQKQYMRQMEGADRLIDEMDAGGLAIGHMSLVVMPFTDCESEFRKVCERVVGRYSAGQLRLKSLGNLQKDAFRHLSPFYVNQPRIDQMLKQILPLDTVTGGEPMTSTLLRDDGGIYFAKTPSGAPICVNMRYRGRNRTNGNLVALGTSGSGKSTALKHLIESMYMLGTKIIIIDPEREYRDLCQNLGGTWLDAGGGVAKSNPLEIRSAPDDDDDDVPALYRSCANARAMHIKTLLVRLRLQFPSLTDAQISLLDKSLIRLYDSFDIDEAVNPLEIPSVNYPIMENWVDLLQMMVSENAAYQQLYTLLWPLAYGSDRFLWNGHTNIDMNAQLVCLDTHRLQPLSQQTQSSIYFQLLSLCWDVASRNRDEPVIILADEAHMLFDPRLPEVGLFVRNIIKRVRKYESALWLATQSVADMLDPQIRLSGQAIIDNTAYRLLFHCDAKNLEDTVDLFRLTAPEAKLLGGFEQKNALCLVGTQHHLRVIFDLPQYKLDLMGRGGGR